MDVLDVACGTGNATIPAAKLAARVTGLDFSPGLLAIAREHGADAMVEVDWIEGDAQALPFEDDSFDRVISCFGHMFAPDHKRTADEMRRVCRPDGRIAIACWTPDGKIGEMFRRDRGDLAPAPEGFQPPLLWGTEDHVRELLGDDVRVRAPRGRVARRVGRGLRGLHGEQLRAADRRARTARRRSCTRPISST